MSGDLQKQPSFSDSVSSGAQAILDARAALNASKEKLARLKSENAALLVQITTSEADIKAAEVDDLAARKTLYKLLGETLPKE